MRIYSQFLSVSVAALLILCAYSRLAGAGFEDWTLEEVLDKVEEANGGEESIKNVTNVRILGEIESPQATYSFLLLKKRPNKFRLSLMYKGRSVETGYDGYTGWRRVDLGTSKEVEQHEKAVEMLIEMRLDESGRPAVARA